MRGFRRDVRPGEAGPDRAAAFVVPVGHEVDLPLSKGAFPHVEVPRREGVGPRVLPLARLTVERPQAEPFQGTPVISPLEEFERDEPVQRPCGGQRARGFHPSVFRWDAAHGIPSSLQEIELALRLDGA